MNYKGTRDHLTMKKPGRHHLDQALTMDVISIEPIRGNEKNAESSLCSCSPKATAATAKSLQSCPTLCDPTDSSPRGSPIPGILQARTLKWVVIAVSKGVVSIEAASVFDFSTSLFKLFLAFCHSKIFPVSWICQIPALASAVSSGGPDFFLGEEDIQKGLSRHTP